MTVRDPREGLRAWVQRGASFSGHERNRVFRQIQGEEGPEFEDVSLLSGADSIQDGRAFAKLDLDWDGAVDLILANSNSPRTELFRNQHRRENGGALWIDLVGSALPVPQDPPRSNRDAVGARVVVQLESGPALQRERRAGEGFASQNTRWIHVGLGSSKAVESIEVRWPSGKTTRLEQSIEANQRIRIYESSSDSPTRSNLERLGSFADPL